VQGKRVDSAGRRVKGRGDANASQNEERYSGRSGNFESVESGGGPGPSKSVEGWIIFISGLNEETNEEGGLCFIVCMLLQDCAQVQRADM
jgi:RNA-binding protein 8A